MEENGGSQPIMPILPRLDRLDSLMKCLEGKYNLSKWCDNPIWAVENRCRPLDLAVKEVYTKGSVLDRIASLENRFLQLSLEIEASCSAQRHGYEGQQGGLMSFHNFDGEDLTHGEDDQRRFHEIHLNMPDLKGKYKEEKIRVKCSTKLKYLLSGRRDGDGCRNDKRRSLKWQCKRWLGC
ncbi:uncharacterized protein LOC131248185 [Magnolia sinica]|uniref:uncharacterized protein LOC131248185 n=1 Tax=Magnolia sinica TaxID=86752 RepID=UPI0026583332|nr:uncharacterized protein LOC131248185 [Magnolia sinica]